jgi:hypothetical protein
MEIKLLEIRDAATFIPIIALRPGARNEAERYLLGMAGYGTSDRSHSEYVLVGELSGGDGRLNCDPFKWEDEHNHTLFYAHKWLDDHWDEIQSGDVLDVEYVRGLTGSPKRSQRLDYPI